MIISETTTVGYQQEFNRIGMQINDSLTTDDWMELYKKLVYWELELESSQVQMTDMLRMQKEEANNAFGKFVKELRKLDTEPRRTSFDESGSFQRKRYSLYWTTMKRCSSS